MEVRNLKEVIKEVKQISDSQETPIEKGIIDLVIGLRRWGIRTIQSCEGHKDDERSYPWVWVPISQARRVCRLVTWQNRPKLSKTKKNRNFWILRPGCSLLLIPENRNRSLGKMRQEAKEFGLFLQKLPSNWKNNKKD